VAAAGRRCLDAGASTGGFTDVLLAAGAVEVVAVDVGYGQLDLRLRQDPRVRVLDRTNVRALTAEQVGGPVDLTVADLSFISLRLVVPVLASLTRRDGDLVVLVKPQFEADRAAVGRGGVVRDPAVRAAAVRGVAEAAAASGLGVAGVRPSPLPGPAGNLELFLHLRAGAAPLDEAALQAAVAEGETLARRGQGAPEGVPR
jgi:23S rRNA (cytidine1920-2'-O)/16S rRNA (cytidine1409-2'-O)-methyltransferase